VTDAVALVMVLAEEGADMTLQVQVSSGGQIAWMDVMEIPEALTVNLEATLQMASRDMPGRVVRIVQVMPPGAISNALAN
jgi:hypothetical protein